MYEDSPTVSRVWMTFDKSRRLEAIESDCHASAGEKKVLCEFGWAQGAHELEFGERLQIPPMAEPVGCCDAVEFRLNELCGTKDPISYFEWREVKVGSGCLPAGEHGVEPVGHLSIPP